MPSGTSLRPRAAAVEAPFASAALAASLAQGWRNGSGPMLTKPLAYGFNIVTLAGFAVMAIGYSLGRAGRGRTASLGRAGRGRAVLGFGLMGIGTALVFLGLFLGGGFG